MLTITLETLARLRAEKIIDDRSFDNLRMLANGMSIEDVAATAKPGRKPSTYAEAIAQLQPGESQRLPIDHRSQASARNIAYRTAADCGFKVSASFSGDGFLVVTRHNDEPSHPQAGGLDIVEATGEALIGRRRLRTADHVAQATKLRQRIERLCVGASIFVPWTLDSLIGCPASTASRIGRNMGRKFTANAVTREGKDGYLITRAK